MRRRERLFIMLSCSIPFLFNETCDNLYSVLYFAAMHGKFYEADCYVVLHTFINKVTNALDHSVWFWVGKEVDVKVSVKANNNNNDNYFLNIRSL